MKYVSHITQCENLESILEFGILPRSILIDRKIQFLQPALQSENQHVVNLYLGHPNFDQFAKLRELGKTSEKQWAVIRILTKDIDLQVEPKGQGSSIQIQDSISPSLLHDIVFFDQETCLKFWEYHQSVPIKEVVNPHYFLSEKDYIQWYLTSGPEEMVADGTIDIYKDEV